LFYSNRISGTPALPFIPADDPYPCIPADRAFLKPLIPQDLMPGCGTSADFLESADNFIQRLYDVSFEKSRIE
jgi:hypothetical protein